MPEAWWGEAGETAVWLCTTWKQELEKYTCITIPQFVYGKLQYFNIAFEISF